MLDISKPGNRDQENVSGTIDRFEKKQMAKMNKRSSWRPTARRLAGFREPSGAGIGLLPLRDCVCRAMLRRKEQPMAECFVAKAS